MVGGKRGEQARVVLPAESLMCARGRVSAQCAQVCGYLGTWLAWVPGQLRACSVIPAA